MNATISKPDALGTAEVLELHNADLHGTSERGFTPILRGADGRLHYGVPERNDAPLAGHEHMQGAFDGYDFGAARRGLEATPDGLQPMGLDAEGTLLRAGYLAAAMGRALDPEAPPEFRRGYGNFRKEDGGGFCADAAADVDRVLGYMRRDGLLPDRRVETPRTGYTLAHVVGWSLVALVGGLAAPGVVAGLAATFGAAP